MKVKQEVRELCVRFRNEQSGSTEWKRLKDILEKKYKFTPFNLLALFGLNPIIEYNDENFSLVMEECQGGGNTES